MLKIAVLLGGKSPEREVSLITGAEIAKQLRLNGHQVIEIDPYDYELGHELLSAIIKHNIDLVFIGLHGGDGENGILQALLSGSNIPFTGSGFKASVIAMDKLLSKFIAAQVNVPYPEYIILNISEYQSKTKKTYQECRVSFPSHNPNKEIVVKPIDAGSSVGVHIISDEEGWQSALADAFNYSEKVMVEEFIEGRELTVTMLDGEALPVVEIKPHSGFYDYPNKYTAGNTTYQAPAALTESETSEIQVYALKIWQMMECAGYARIDFRYDGKKFYFLELNTLPGMTPLSLTPMAAKAVGFSFGDLLERIIQAVPLTKIKKNP